MRGHLATSYDSCSSLSTWKSRNFLFNPSNTSSRIRNVFIRDLKNMVWLLFFFYKAVHVIIDINTDKVWGSEDGIRWGKHCENKIIENE